MVEHNNNSYKKTIAVFMLLITAFVFLSVNVYAETPVQALQVVTYSDTSTNVRISGTAERLHYNIDSFQVVFMNPPNNYGTSCTPVLVSFRFYNASDTPAYVGQAEFELTATSSTGSVNTIIYGYDQISTDLFVAESSYSTAEVGRIGIGAANDFSYYTGFVIPPRTSLYFSCIVYVNASAYAQNNTGTTEDVNQVTLSALNLYSNQISFSDDYPYHNQPVDFSDIIDAISDLADTVSTSSEMQSIIDILSYTGSSYNPDIPNAPAYTSALFNRNGLQVRLTRYVGKGRLVNTDFELNTSNDTTVSYTQYVYPVLLVLQTNPSSKNHVVPNEIRFNNVFPFGSAYIENQFSNIADIVTYADFVSFNWRIKYDSWRSVVPNRQSTSLYVFNCYFNSSNITWPTLSVVDIDSSYPIVTTEYFPFDEYSALRDLVNAYNQVNGLDDSSDISNDVTDVSDSNHVIEESYYSANASAIEATGLSNYHFTNEQNNGIGSVANDFMLLWNALGSWNGVYIFSLTMALATFIMRHGGLFTIKRETSDKGGDGE